MVFDVKAWAAWALANDIDSRGIDFVLTYPESITGGRTTPRSITSFFEQIKKIDDLKANLDLVSVLARSALDDVTVASFISFVNDNLEQLISPTQILDAESFEPIGLRLEELAGHGSVRVDRLATICTRLYLELTREGYAPGPRHADNLVAFLLHESLPNDLRFSLHRDLVQAPLVVRRMARDKRLAVLLLSGM